MEKNEHKEIQRVYRSIYLQNLKEGAIIIAGGIACEALAYGGMRGAFSLEKTHEGLSYALFGLSLMPIIPGIQLFGHGVGRVIESIKQRVGFNKEDWSRPALNIEKGLAKDILSHNRWF